VAKQVLIKLGCEVVIASNGREALEAFESQQFDVILMDLQMPDIDGFEATRIIRAKETSRRTPIIAQTAHAFSEDRQRCLDAGMDEHISKPIRTAELLEVLTRYCTSAGRDAAPENSVCDRIQDHGGSCPDRTVFDLEALRNRLGDDEEAVREIVDLFLVETPDLVSRLRSAAVAEEWGVVARLAHTLKGASANFGAVALAALAGEMEQAAKDPNNAGLQTLLSKMDLEFKELKQHVEKLGM